MTVRDRHPGKTAVAVNLPRRSGTNLGDGVPVGVSGLKAPGGFVSQGAFSKVSGSSAPVGVRAPGQEAPGC